VFFEWGTEWLQIIFESCKKTKPRQTKVQEVVFKIKENISAKFE
jgi:hypothetical protein